MAFFCAFSAFSKPPTYSKNIQKTGKSANLIDNTCMQMAQGSSICQDHAVNFLPEYHNSTDDFYVEYVQKLKKFKNILGKNIEDPLEGLNMVNLILRLGIEYHYQEEIEAILQRQYAIFSAHAGDDHDLHEVALGFRLLRQEGYHVSCSKFKNKEGKFKLELAEDITGLMELYEASQVNIGDEHILDEAKDFSRHFLEAKVKHLDHQRARLIVNTLEHPYHKSLPRWWKGLGLAKELKFARNQPLKWYMWTAACLTDPSWSDQRIELTKPISLVYVIDDMFDVYGTLDELTLFTNAVNRWELAATEQLPDPLKMCFVALYDITNEISYKVYNRSGWDPIRLPKKSGEGISKETVDLLDNNPSMISSIATILRLWDDLGSAQDENQNGHDGSYIECYRKEHQGCSVEGAQSHVIQMISNAWNCLNKNCLTPNPFPASFIKASLNAARMVPLMYSYDDKHCLPSLEKHMKSLIFEKCSL
uniref:Terpene synthase N-terminal domain-containing protein n=1 Tax=Fagus sylvatica TaxID=28930 RepID=A0A2N9FHJ4_FAGSY